MSKLNEKLAEEYAQRIAELNAKVEELDKSLQDKEQIVIKHAAQHKAYVVEPLYEGTPVFIHKESNNVMISNSGEKYKHNKFDKSIVSLSVDDFILSATLNKDTLVVTDIIYFKNKDLCSTPLYKRKKLLDGFCWENTKKNISLNEHVIVKSIIDLKESCRFYSLDHKRIIIRNYDEGVSKDNKSFIFEDETFELKKLLSVDGAGSLELDVFSDNKIIDGFINVLGSSNTKSKEGGLTLQINMAKPSKELVAVIENHILSSVGERFKEKIGFVWGDVGDEYDSVCPIYNLCLVCAKPRISSIVREDMLMKPFTIPIINSKLTGNDELMAHLKTITKSMILEKNDGEPISIHKRGDDYKVFSSSGKDITNLFTKLTKDILSLTKQDIIVIGGVDLEDEKVKQIILWDVVFFNKPLFDTKLYERKKALNALSFSDNILRADPFVVSNENELNTALEALKGSFVLKKWDAPYELTAENKQDIFVELNN